VNIQVRFHGLAQEQDLETYARKRLGSAVGRVLDARPSTISVALSDDNGPRGGIDKTCRVVLRSKDVLLVCEARSADALSAVDVAADRLASALGRQLARTRGIVLRSQRQAS
jgi:ribosome-associated translation inhibitor RaiA